MEQHSVPSGVFFGDITTPEIQTAYHLDKPTAWSHGESFGNQATK
jgi:hypothetical protein